MNVHISQRTIVSLGSEHGEHLQRGRIFPLPLPAVRPMEVLEGNISQCQDSK